MEPPFIFSRSPQLYEEECQRVQERFNEAVRLAKHSPPNWPSFSHLSERLSGQEDGKPKVFRDSAVANLLSSSRGSAANVRSTTSLTRTVNDDQRIIRGVVPQELRDNGSLRQHVATEMSRVESVLDGLLVDRPRRAILRRPR